MRSQRNYAGGGLAVAGAAVESTEAAIAGVVVEDARSVLAVDVADAIVAGEVIEAAMLMHRQMEPEDLGWR